MPDGRVLVDVGGSFLAATPGWSRFDEIGSSCRCAGFDISNGRQSEFDSTDTGTATVYFNDRAGTLDDPELVGSPIQLQVRDPVGGGWHEQFRGLIDDVTYEPNPNAFVSNVQLKCKDLFDYLARAQMILGVHGDVAPAGVEGVTFWEENPANTRIEDLLDAAEIDPALYIVFDLNVDVHDTVYDSGDSFLVAIRDACDAEFPGIANVYCDRKGRVVVHGRFARFDPDGTAGTGDWDFNRWNAATRANVVTGQAAVRAFSYNRPISRIRNAAIAWPRYNVDQTPFAEADKAAQVKTDATSITRYGYCAMPPMGDLIIKEHKTNGNTGAEECELFAEFYVNNYADPRTNIQRVTFRSTRPDHKAAAETWALMTQADISDIIHLTIGEAGLADEEFYIEGFTKELRVLNPDFDDYTVTPNLTPFAYYTDNVFEEA